MYNKSMKMGAITFLFLISSVFSQKSDNIYQLGLNAEDEVIRVLSFIPFESEKIVVKDSKEKFILKILKDKLKDMPKYKAHIVCSGLGESKDGTYTLLKSRACKFIKSNELLYKAHDISVKESIAELELVDKVLSQAYKVSDFDKSVVDSDRAITETNKALEASTISTKPKDAVAK